MVEIKAPTQVVYDKRKVIFMAGSINQDNASSWAKTFIEAFEDFDIQLLNPRRDKWDNTLEQTIDNPVFVEQVNWELDNLEMADLIIMHFDKEGPSPITLLELGLFAREDNVLVCCPKEFWRKGNVDIVCQRNGIPLVETLEELIELTKEFLKKI